MQAVIFGKTVMFGVQQEVKKKNQRYFQIAVTFMRGVGVLLSEHFSFYDHRHTSDLGVG